jgi:hypothetical protein
VTMEPIMPHTDKQRRAALKAAKKCFEAYDALSVFWDECCAGQEARADHSVAQLKRDLNEYGTFLELRYRS